MTVFDKRKAPRINISPLLNESLTCKFYKKKENVEILLHSTTAWLDIIVRKDIFDYTGCGRLWRRQGEDP